MYCFWCRLLQCSSYYYKKNATVSQRTYLCTASHNISSSLHEQIEKPIIIEPNAWVAAEAFIGPGVTIGEGAVVGARACVYKDVKPWTVVGGNPAKYIKDRIIKIKAYAKHFSNNINIQ